MPSKPKISPQLDGLKLEWLSEKITCDVTAIYQHHDGNVACELHLYTSQEGFGPHLLRHHINDLSNATSRDRLAGLLTKSYNHVPWGDMTETICEYVLLHLRRPPKLTTSTDFIEAQPPEFILWPFLVRHENNMLFSPGGGGKSNLGLYWLILLETAKRDNPLNWIVRERPIIGLYLDWERSYKTQSYRMRGLLGGLELPVACPDTPLNYYHPTAPMIRETRNVQSLIDQAKASFVIYDSCGPAGGGDMNKSEIALGFFNAIAPLKAFDGEPLTNLLLAHTSKDPTTSRRTPYGNAYWGNECSSIWELVPGESTEHNLNRLTLHCFKHNDYAWIQDIGVEISYEGEDIIYKPGVAAMKAGAGEGHEHRILEVLDKARGPQEIANLTGLDEGVVSVMLNRMSKSGVIKHQGRGLWLES